MHRFRIEGDELVGDGAAFLERELDANRAILLGEYHGSQRISELTRVLIRGFHERGCRHMALEIGPTSARMLTELAGDGSGTVENLRAFHAATSIEGDTRAYTAIPFFGGVSDAEFLAEAAERDWRLIGFDQEFIFGLAPLVDVMLGRAPAEALAELEPLADAARESIWNAYEMQWAEEAQAPLVIAESAALDAFLERVAQTGPENARTARDMRTSIEIYRLNSVGDWWASNGTRIAHMKQNLARGLTETGFDFAEDRLLVKVGGVHSGRGLSLLRHYEVGNTVSEMVEMHGGTSLHVEFATRYWKEDGEVVDELEEDRRYEVVRQLGREDEWTLVDLRPLKKAVYYDRLELAPYLEEWFVQHDVIAIPPADESPEPNR